MNSWWRVSGFRWGNGARIEPIQILKSTSSSVWINGRRNAKLSEHDAYFETEAEAVKFARECVTRRRDYGQKIADECNAYLAKLAIANERTDSNKERQ